VQRRANSLGVLRQGTVSGGAASPLLTDLVAYWKLDDLTWSDSVGSNNLTNNGSVTIGTPKVGAGSAEFDGTNFLNLNPGIAVSSDLSISLWCYPDAGYGSGTNAGLIEQFNDWGRIFINNTTGVIQARVKQSSGIERAVATSTVISTAAWSHIVLVANSTTGVATLYVNNTSVGSQTYDGTLRSVGDDLVIGQQLSDFFDGRIDEAGFWSRVLTVSEISDLYNSGSGLSYPFS
jgi:hypothetical protein